MRRTYSNSGDNKTPGRPKWMMPVVFTVCACLAGYLVFNLVPTSSSTPSLPRVVSVLPATSVAPKSATIFIDDSRSMLGYVKGSGDFNYVLADLMNVYPNVTKAQALNDTEIISQSKDLTTRLLSGKMTNGGESLLNEGLKKIVSLVSGKDRIAFFVTDAIMSGSTSDINQNPRYNIDQKQNLMHDISNVFLGKNLAVSVYRLMSDFNGPYYCFDNEFRNIHTQRAYYVLAIGSPGVVVHFKQQLDERKKDKLFKFKPINEIHFIDNQPINKRPYVYGGDVNPFTLPIDSQYHLVSFDSKKVDNASSNKLFGVFKVSVPLDAFSNYSLSPKELIKQMKVYANGTPYTTNLTLDSLTHSISFKVDRQVLPTKTDNGTLRIVVPYFTPEWIDNPGISINGDDHYMLNPAEADASTFLFSYFIQGIKNGVVPQNQGSLYIYDSTLYFMEK